VFSELLSAEAHSLALTSFYMGTTGMPDQWILAWWSFIIFSSIPLLVKGL
jgi:hypothetical protein